MSFVPQQAERSRRASLVAKCIGVGALLMASIIAAQANTALDGDGIRKKVTGKRIYLAAPLGGEFPLFYQRGGRVDGSGEAVGLGRWIRPTDSGRWWVQGDKLCQKWQTWYDGKTICFELTQVGQDRLRWVQDNGDTGVARIGN
ncbi:MAG: hypothetical protein ACRCWO_13440 [Bosea sp. (in: a-proteobacteria)]